MSAPRVLITGITGQDGFYLARQLRAEGCEVVGLVRSPDRLDASGVGASALVAGELDDPASLRAAVAEVAPDELYHLAAPTFVPASWDDPAAAVSAIAVGTAALLGAVRAHAPQCRVVVASSSEIFGDTGESPMHERTPMRPRSPYGVAKLCAHGLAGTLRTTGLHVCSAVMFNHESPRRPERFLPRKVTRGAAAISLGLQDTLELGDLSAVRDWSDARDIVRGLVLMARAGEPGDYVLASGLGRTVQDLVDAAFAHAGADAATVRVNPEFVRPPEPWPQVGDASHAARAAGMAL